MKRGVALFAVLALVAYGAGYLQGARPTAAMGEQLVELRKTIDAATADNQGLRALLKKQAEVGPHELDTQTFQALSDKANDELRREIERLHTRVRVLEELLEGRRKVGRLPVPDVGFPPS